MIAGDNQETSKISNENSIHTTPVDSRNGIYHLEMNIEEDLLEEIKPVKGLPKLNEIRLVLDRENKLIRKRRNKLRQRKRRAESRRMESGQSTTAHEEGRIMKENIITYTTEFLASYQEI